jgi:hypothetical protein
MGRQPTESCLLLYTPLLLGKEDRNGSAALVSAAMPGCYDRPTRPPSCQPFSAPAEVRASGGGIDSLRRVVLYWLAALGANYTALLTASICRDQIVNRLQRRVMKPTIARWPLTTFAVLSLLATVSILAQQQLVDPDFLAAVERPAYPNDGPTVAIDEAHDNFHTAAASTRPSPRS